MATVRVGWLDAHAVLHPRVTAPSVQWRGCFCRDRHAYFSMGGAVTCTFSSATAPVHLSAPDL